MTAEQASFEFDTDNAARAKAIIARYPAGREQSALLPLLDLAQRQAGGWLPRAAIEFVAKYLALPRIRVEEVVSFYTMFFTRPVGTHVVWVCTTTPCWLRGSDAILERCKRVLGCDAGENSADGKFTLTEAECLGACVNAPMVQINDDFYEDLDADKIAAVLEALRRGERPRTGSQSGRHTSEPEGGATTLKGGS